MSLQDVQTIREGYEAFNRKDIPGVLQRFDPQISGTSRVGAAPQRRLPQSPNSCGQGIQPCARELR